MLFPAGPPAWAETSKLTFGESVTPELEVHGADTPEVGRRLVSGEPADIPLVDGIGEPLATRKPHAALPRVGLGLGRRSPPVTLILN